MRGRCNHRMAYFGLTTAHEPKGRETFLHFMLLLGPLPPSLRNLLHSLLLNLLDFLDLLFIPPRSERHNPHVS